MSLFAPPSGERRDASLSEVLAAQRGGRAYAGVPVNLDSAMRHAAVWSSVNLIADLISTMPIGGYRKSGGVRTELPSQPRIITDPSADVDPINWLRQQIVSWLLRGNTVGRVVATDSMGYPTQIEPEHPDALTFTKHDGRVQWKLDGTNIDKYPLGELWHVPAFTIPGAPLGLSPIRYAAQGIGLGLAAEQFGEDWFVGGGHPTGVFQTDQSIDKGQAKTIKDRIVAALRGGRGEPLVLGLGMKYQPIQIAPEESQFLDTINANRATVASFFGLRPEDVGSSVQGGSITYQNVEQQQLGRLVYPIYPWVVRLEEALSRLLPRGQFVRFNVDAHVRVDLLNRTRVHDLNIRMGRHSVDDTRRLEDEEPLPDGKGENYLWPPYRTSPAPSDDTTTEETSPT